MFQLYKNKYITIDDDRSFVIIEALNRSATFLTSEGFKLIINIELCTKHISIK